MNPGLINPGSPYQRFPIKENLDLTGFCGWALMVGELRPAVASDGKVRVFPTSLPNLKGGTMGEINEPLEWNRDMTDDELLKHLFLLFMDTGHYRAIINLRGKTPLTYREQADLYFIDQLRKRTKIPF